MRRNIWADEIYHIYNRGVSKMQIFKNARDYQRFMLKIYEFRLKYPVTFYVYCLMPNHFHLLIESEYKKNISKFMKNLQYSHARYYNIKYNHKGHVFESEYKCKRIDTEAYYIQIQEYIRNNPVRKGLVRNAEHWPYTKKFTR